jgi:hypothetical protein
MSHTSFRSENGHVLRGACIGDSRQITQIPPHAHIHAMKQQFIIIILSKLNP